LKQKQKSTDFMPRVEIIQKRGKLERILLFYGLKKRHLKPSLGNTLLIARLLKAIKHRLLMHCERESVISLTMTSQEQSSHCVIK
jgi:hypothetical protein